MQLLSLISLRSRVLGLARLYALCLAILLWFRNPSIELVSLVVKARMRGRGCLNDGDIFKSELFADNLDNAISKEFEQLFILLGHEEEFIKLTDYDQGKEVHDNLHNFLDGQQNSHIDKLNTYEH